MTQQRVIFRGCAFGGWTTKVTTRNSRAYASLTFAQREAARFRGRLPEADLEPVSISPERKLTLTF